MPELNGPLLIFALWYLIRSKLGLLSNRDWPFCVGCTRPLWFWVRHPTIPSYCKSCADDRVRSIYRTVRQSSPL